MDIAEHIALYRGRRERLARALPDGVAVVPTAPERVRNRDSHYPYRFDSHFYYLTGFPEPEAVLVVVGGAAPRTLLFCRERSDEREIWDGFRYGPAAARERFGFDEAHPFAKLDEMLPALLENQPSLHYPVGADPEWDARAMRWLNAVRTRVRAGIAAPQRVQDVRAAIDEMRVVKDAHELALMRRAARIAAAAHRRAMQSARPGRGEYEIEAELLHEFRRSGAQFPAYSPIVAGGANACVLHYVANDAPLRDGDLLLIDAGCELDGYASDLTRQRPGAPGRRLERGARCGGTRAGAGHARSRAAARLAAGGAGERDLQALLYAPHRALAGSRCARRRRLPARRGLARAGPRHGADGGARDVHPARRRRAVAAAGDRRAHRG